MKKLTTLAKKKLVITALEDIKAHDIQAIDVRRITALFDWIVVASADSARQSKSLARHVRDRLREAGSVIVGMEGEESGDWILVDAGDVVAHVMQPAVRSYYSLEELWGEGRFDKPVNSTVPAKRERKGSVRPEPVEGRGSTSSPRTAHKRTVRPEPVEGRKTRRRKAS